MEEEFSRLVSAALVGVAQARFTLETIRAMAVSQLAYDKPANADYAIAWISARMTLVEIVTVCNLFLEAPQ